MGIGSQYGWDLSLIQTPLPLLAATIGLSGVLFSLLGIIAEVQARIYFVARGRPLPAHPMTARRHGHGTRRSASSR
jgi:hypothetical protein